jgi:hypothetical protein
MFLINKRETLTAALDDIQQILPTWMCENILKKLMYRAYMLSSQQFLKKTEIHYLRFRSRMKTTPGKEQVWVRDVLLQSRSPITRAVP